MPEAYIDKLALIEVKNHKALVTLDRGENVWYLPGGKREPDESDEIALIREIREELGVEILPKTINFFGTFEAKANNQPDTMVRMTCYTAEYKGALKASGEIEKYDFFDYAQKHRTSAVSQLVFDDLKQKGLIK